MPRYLFPRKLDYAAIDKLFDAGMKAADIAKALDYNKFSVSSYISRLKAKRGTPRPSREDLLTLNKVEFERHHPLLRWAFQNRKDRKMSITEIAVKSGYSETTVKSWVRGERGLSFYAAACVAQVLGYELVLRDRDDKTRIADGSDLVDHGRPVFRAKGS